MNFKARWIVVSTMLGCTPGASHEETLRNDGTTIGPSSGGAVHCDLSVWDGAAQTSDCSRPADDAEASWSCHCGGRAAEADASLDCDEALAQACPEEAEMSADCVYESLGACKWLDEQWSCACPGDLALTPTQSTAEECGTALWRHCSQGCSKDDDECEPTGSIDEFACYCSYYDATITRVASCENALRSCRPSASGCSQPQGICVQGGTEFHPYDCTCIDGTTVTVEADGSSCDEVVSAACGPPPEDVACEEVLDDGAKRVSCKRDPESKPQYWACQCTFSGASGDGALGDEVVAASCQEALESFCR